MHKFLALLVLAPHLVNTSTYRVRDRDRLSVRVTTVSNSSISSHILLSINIRFLSEQYLSGTLFLKPASTRIPSPHSRRSSVTYPQRCAPSIVVIRESGLTITELELENKSVLCYSTCYLLSQVSAISRLAEPSEDGNICHTFCQSKMSISMKWTARVRCSSNWTHYRSNVTINDRLQSWQQRASWDRQTDRQTDQ